MELPPASKPGCFATKDRGRAGRSGAAPDACRSRGGRSGGPAPISSRIDLPLTMSSGVSALMGWARTKPVSGRRVHPWHRRAASREKAVKGPFSQFVLLPTLVTIPAVSGGEPQLDRAAFVALCGHRSRPPRPAIPFGKVLQVARKIRPTVGTAGRSFNKISLVRTHTRTHRGITPSSLQTTDEAQFFFPPPP